MKSTNIRIDDVTYSYEDILYRTPIKFGGVALDRATLVNVKITIHTVAGKTAAVSAPCRSATSGPFRPNSSPTTRPLPP